MVQTHLGSVEELSKRDVSFVAEHVVGLKVVVGAILEPDSQECTILRGRPMAKLEGKSRRIVGCVSHHGAAMRSVRECTHGWQRAWGVAW